MNALTLLADAVLALTADTEATATCTEEEAHSFMEEVIRKAKASAADPEATASAQAAHEQAKAKAKEDSVKEHQEKYKSRFSFFWTKKTPRDEAAEERKAFAKQLSKIFVRVVIIRIVVLAAVAVVGYFWPTPAQ